jgi:hypothetical protein
MTFRNARDAAARGAVPIPEAYDKWPGGWSLMTALAKTEYPGPLDCFGIHNLLINSSGSHVGDFLLDWFETYGNTFKATVAFDPVVSIYLYFILVNWHQSHLCALSDIHNRAGPHQGNPGDGVRPFLEGYVGAGMHWIGVFIIIFRPRL